MTQISVTPLTVMGNDLTVVNAARVSFDKQSSYTHDTLNDTWELPVRDQDLLVYLAKHGHWSPFSHAFASFRIKAPIFVARQLAKHQVGLSWNEVSRRYVDSEPEFYCPTQWRLRADNVKQGSSEEFYDGIPYYNRTDVKSFSPNSLMRLAGRMYRSMLDQGICPEQARMVLPQSMMTEWIWSGSLYAFARVCKLRLDPHTQKETQEVARVIAAYLNKQFPHSWMALNG